jgi:hypothetical protein
VRGILPSLLAAQHRHANRLLRRLKISNPSLASSFAGASDERPREEKSAPYRNTNYPDFLSEDVNNYKSYMRDHELGMSEAGLLARIIPGVGEL